MEITKGGAKQKTKVVKSIVYCTRQNDRIAVYFASCKKRYATFKNIMQENKRKIK